MSTNVTREQTYVPLIDLILSNVGFYFKIKMVKFITSNKS